MSTENEIKELEKNRRSSARAIPFDTGLLIAAAIALWILAGFFTVSVWVTIIVLGILAFTLIGDIHNYFYCGRKLRMLKHDHAA